MDDSDDYIVDDIVFDDQTLAALDKEEKKYLQQSTSTIASEGHVNKRHKTSTGWKPGIGANLQRADSYEDLPEISLRGDGSYGLGNPVQALANSIPGLGVQESRYQQPARSVESHSLSRTVPQAHASSSRLQIPSNPPSNLRVNQHVQNLHAREQESGISRKQNVQQVSTELESQMLELQKKLEEMRNENSKIQSALKEAVDAKLAREGEVSILRKNIEKTAQNHAAQLAQLKAEREKAELKQAQMQKDMKDEVERLKTQFVFKQQELESAMRKPPPSVRAKKISKDFPSTPLVGPSGMAVWNRDSSQVPTSRGMADETPVRPSRFSAVPRQSPSKHNRKSPEKPRKQAMLPGFENAFDTSTPLRPSLRRDKGKAKENQDLLLGGSIPQIPYELSQPIRIASQLQPKYEASQNLHHDTTTGLSWGVPESQGPDNEEMDIMPPATVQDIVLEEVDDFEPLDRKRELCRILLMHSYAATSEGSLQRLLGSAHLVGNAHMHTYSTSCTRILEVIGNYSAHDDEYEKSMEVVSAALLSLLALLHESQQLQLMTIVLNLLAQLVLYLSCQSFLLSSRPPLKEGQTTSMIDLICSFILVYLDPSKVGVTGREFADELFTLLESLCFRISTECVQQLDALARQKKALMLLFHSSQPAWLLERSASLLALLSTHHRLAAALLDCTEVKEPSPNREYDPRKNPFIERLCWFLIDSARSPVENAKLYVLICFSQLSIAHPDAYTELVDTYALIPSLVLYTSHLAAPIWEDEETLLVSPEVATSYVQALSQTTLLLHHLIFETDPCLNVRLKLHEAPHRPFNGIDHMFVVTFGRLSYGDPPSWLELQNKQTIQYLVDIAREILELVIDGPETDSVWAAFQAEQDEESAMDEGEMEARLMGVEI